MEGLIPIENSSNLTGYFYERITRCLFIEFKGGSVYSYDAVPQEVIDEFAKAESKGSFLAKHIKGHYNCTKFEAAKKEEDSKNNA